MSNAARICAAQSAPKVRDRRPVRQEKYRQARAGEFDPKTGLAIVSNLDQDDDNRNQSPCSSSLTSI